MPILLLVRPLLLLCLGIVILYICASFLLYMSQHRLLYHPRPYSMAEAQRQSLELGLVPWPPAAPFARAYIDPQGPTDVRGTVLVFHGNAGTALDRIGYMDDLHPHGLRVVLAEYPGYGPFPGKPRESTLVTAACDLARDVAVAFPEPLYILGESLGAGVACAVAADPNCPVAGLLLITPWDSLPELAQSLYPLFPCRALVKDQYDSIANLKEFSNPIALVMADQDEVIPNARTLNLAQALGDKAKLWILTGVGHNNWPHSTTPDWWSEVVRYLLDSR